MAYSDGGTAEAVSTVGRAAGLLASSVEAWCVAYLSSGHEEGAVYCVERLLNSRALYEASAWDGQQGQRQRRTGAGWARGM
jgi:hypothetical protein